MAAVAPAPVAPSPSLKKLGFVPEVGHKGYDLASNVYSTAKGYVPASLKPRLDAVEESVSNVSAPYLAKAQDKGAELLRLADDQVDRAVVTAHQVYEKNSAYLSAQLEKQKSLHANNLETYKHAREHYLGIVESSVEYLRHNGLSGAAKSAADEVGARVSKAREVPGYVLRRVHDAVEVLLARSRGTVDATADRLKPTLDAAYARYSGIHERVVTSPAYARAVAQAQAFAIRAQATGFYQRATTTVYPYLKPYAEPAYARVEPLVAKVQAHLTPKELAA